MLCRFRRRPGRAGRVACHPSSAVEQCFRKAQVAGSNPVGGFRVRVDASVAAPTKAPLGREAPPRSPACRLRRPAPSSVLGLRPPGAAGLRIRELRTPSHDPGHADRESGGWLSRARRRKRRRSHESPPGPRGSASQPRVPAAPARTVSGPRPADPRASRRFQSAPTSVPRLWKGRPPPLRCTLRPAPRLPRGGSHEQHEHERGGGSGGR